jgi:hypothetical protein
MTYQTRLLTFYWERLGYESNSISSQRQYVARNIQGHSPEEPAGIATAESPAGASPQGAASQKPMG